MRLNSVRAAKSPKSLRPFAAPRGRCGAFHLSPDTDIQRPMLKRLTATLAAATFLACGLAATAAQAEPTLPTVPRLDLTTMMGRWYEIARLPNKTQSGCQAGASDWTRAGD